nr:DNA repair protein RecO [Maliibacterium massiliense]
MEKIEGIVVRTANYKEYDRMITILSPQRGCVHAGARGCRRPASKLRPAGQLFCFGEFMLREIGAGKYTVTQVSVRDSFFDLALDLDAFTCATYLANLCEEVAVDGEMHAAVFSWLLYALTELCYGKLPPQDVALCVLLRIMDTLGFRPEMNACVVCGAPVAGEGHFSAALGGMLCTSCRGQDAQAQLLHAGSRSGMAMLLDMPRERLSTFRLSADMRAQLMDALPLFAQYRLEKRFRSQRLMDALSHLQRQTPQKR